MLVKEILYEKPDIYNQSLLVLEISGSDIHYSLINSLRHVCYSEIPIYAFKKSDIKITKNDSIDNNSKLSMTLSQLPILNLNHSVIYLEDKYYKKNTIEEKHPDDNFLVEYYLNVKNDKSIEPIFISTDDIKATVNGKHVKLHFNTPVVLSQLRNNEETEFFMKSSLSIGNINSIFNASHTYQEEIDKNTFHLKIESYGQFDEYEILNRACQILIFKFKNLKNVFNKEKDNIDEEVNYKKFYIDNENHTTIGPLKYYLLSSKNIVNCGITLYSGFMNDNILLYVETNGKHNILEEIYIAIDNCIEFYDNLNKKINK